MNQSNPPECTCTTEYSEGIEHVDAIYQKHVLCDCVMTAASFGFDQLPLTYSLAWQWMRGQQSSKSWKA